MIPDRDTATAIMSMVLFFETMLFFMAMGAFVR